eukprot:2393262-Lingulodinium_polyedra.AAC.1
MVTRVLHVRTDTIKKLPHHWHCKPEKLGKEIEIMKNHFEAEACLCNELGDSMALAQRLFQEEVAAPTSPSKLAAVASSPAPETGCIKDIEEDTILLQGRVPAKVTAKKRLASKGLMAALKLQKLWKKKSARHIADKQECVAHAQAQESGPSGNEPDLCPPE